MVVADASVLIELLLLGPAAALVERRLFGEGETVHAPHLVDVEVAQGIRRCVRRGTMTAERGLEAVTDLGNLTLTRYPHDVFLNRIWGLRANLTAYDAAYIALAEALGAPLVTRDRRLASAPGHRARIEVV